MGEEPTLGFEFQTWIINGAGYRAVSVLYVLPGSPAEKKVCGVTGFYKINGANVSDGNVSDLLSGENGCVGCFGSLFQLRYIRWSWFRPW